MIKWFSLIIPMYNCERYIGECLDCIYSNDLSDEQFEVIVVDDESRDNGVAVVSKYQSVHKNLFLFQQENSGPATARQYGLMKAQGKYVWFVDADDRINPSLFITLQETIHAHPDVEALFFNYTCEYADREESVVHYTEVMVQEGTDYLMNNDGRLYLWNHVFAREKISKAFIEGLHHIEDKCFIVENVIHFTKVLCMKENGYFYNCRNQSSISHTHSDEKVAQANEDAFCVYTT